MRAFAIDAFGEEGSIRELPDPAPGDGEVLVRVNVAGMNATDSFVMSGFAASDSKGKTSDTAVVVIRP
jgi:NADPH:quinone reductase-like Zn-dependent oxidoreductase